MQQSHPIIYIDDDRDDQEMLQNACTALKLNNSLKMFDTCEAALSYLKTTEDEPLVIISDVNLPVMSGTEMKRFINENDYLKKKSIPFIFLSTSLQRASVEKAYDLMAQGYFTKPNSFEELKYTIASIVDYWKRCRHPYS